MNRSRTGTVPEKPSGRCIFGIIHGAFCLLVEVAVDDYFAYFMHVSEGHLEHRFGTMPEEWKEIQLHVDSKCRSAYRSKSRGLPQTIHAFRSRTMEQDVGYVRGLGTVSAETCSSNSDPHLQENPLTVKVA